MKYVVEHKRRESHHHLPAWQVTEVLPSGKKRPACESLFMDEDEAQQYAAELAAIDDSIGSTQA